MSMKIQREIRKGHGTRHWHDFHLQQQTPNEKIKTIYLYIASRIYKYQKHIPTQYICYEIVDTTQWIFFKRQNIANMFGMENWKMKLKLQSYKCPWGSIRFTTNKDLHYNTREKFCGHVWYSVLETSLQHNQQVFFPYFLPLQFSSSIQILWPNY